MTTRISRVWVLIFFGAAVCGALGYIALTKHYENVTLRLQIQTYIIDQTRVSSSFFQYGTIASVDTATEVILVYLENRFVPGAPARLVSVHVEKGAYIARQELLAHKGTYDALSEPVLVGLTEIREGDHVAIFNELRDGKLTTRYILIGNPL